MTTREFKDAKGQLVALVVRRDFTGGKHNFLTSPDEPLQVGVNFYREGDLVPAHRHHRQARVIDQTQEFVLVADGEVLFEIFDDDEASLGEVRLATGDFIVFARGGHRWQFGADTKIIEVKQGPYVSPEADKAIFEGEDHS